MKQSTAYIVLDEAHNIHRIVADTLIDLFQKATDMGITIFDYEVEEGEQFA